MLLNTDFWSPRDLTGYARRAFFTLPEHQVFLDRFLPYQPIDDLVYRFTRGGDSLIAAAPYRAYDAESTITKRPGMTRVSGELPPISRKIVLGEYDRLRQRANPNQSIRDAILDDTDRVVRQISVRLEVARADALVNGSVTIDENGVKASVDFNRSGSASVTAATLWSNTTTADIIGDLGTWVQAYTDMNGQPPGVFLTSRRIRGFMLKNQGIRDLASTLVGTPSVVSADTLTRILDSYDLPPVVTYDARYDLNGTATRYIADNLGLLLPAPGDPGDPNSTDLGGTFSGTTAESLDPSYSLEDAQAGIVAGVYRSEDPIALWTKAAAIALPVLANPNLSWKVTAA